MIDILGIGNALVDIFFFSEDETALALGLHPNNAAHVSSARMDELLLAVRSPLYVAGGGAANALKGAASFGASCLFIGCTGSEDDETDRWARLFAEDLESFGIARRIESRKHATGRCLVVRMPGSMKSIACAPGAAPSIRPEQVTSELVAGARAVLLDGQCLRNRELAVRTAALCRDCGTVLALDLASAHLARESADLVLSLLAETDVVLLMNADEASALALALGGTVPGDRGIQRTEELIDTVFSFHTRRENPFPCIIEKRGELGARAWRAGKRYSVPGLQVPALLDDTGAGDIFGGVFLRAMLLGWPTRESLAAANRAAALKLAVPGSRIDRDRFTALCDELEAEANGRPPEGNRT